MGRGGGSGVFGGGERVRRAEERERGEGVVGVLEGERRGGERDRHSW